MDAVARRRCLLLIPARAFVLASAVSLVFAGCGARRSGGPVGVSTAAPGAGARAGGEGPDAGAKRAGAGIPADFRTIFTRVNRARFVSKGHAAGRWDVDVYVSSAGKDAFGLERGDFPVGTQIIEEHFERARTGAEATGPVMMMEKRARGFDPEHGDWRFVVVGAGGDVVKDGAIESCRGCHDDAPRDHVFRVTE